MCPWACVFGACMFVILLSVFVFAELQHSVPRTQFSFTKTGKLSAAEAQI